MFLLQKNDKSPAIYLRRQGCIVFLYFIKIIFPYAVDRTGNSGCKDTKKKRDM